VLIGMAPVFRSGTIQPTDSERDRDIKRLKQLAKDRHLDIEQMYCAMENVELWGSDTQEDFGRKKSVGAQVKMLYDEATLRLGHEDGLALAEKTIRAAEKE